MLRTIAHEWGYLLYLLPENWWLQLDPPWNLADIDPLNNTSARPNWNTGNRPTNQYQTAYRCWSRKLNDLSPEEQGLNSLKMHLRSILGCSDFPDTESPSWWLQPRRAREVTIICCWWLLGGIEMAAATVKGFGHSAPQVEHWLSSPSPFPFRRMTWLGCA